MIKPYQTVPIVESHEPLVELPIGQFPRVSPHPYQNLGAPYGKASPFYSRHGVVDRLLKAQQQVQQHHPDWKIQIFDAYRPIPVQRFMVDYSFRQLVKHHGLIPETLTPEQRQEFFSKVHQFWAAPNPDPTMPPPHSTGGAIDVTLVDASGQPIPMGAEIDEISDRSFPDYFANSNDLEKQRYHQHRQILTQAMIAAGFRQHPNEWWHFSYGDQMWAWLMGQKVSQLVGQTVESIVDQGDPKPQFIAQYGGVEV